MTSVPPQKTSVMTAPRLLFLVVLSIAIATIALSFPVGVYTVFGAHLSGNYSETSQVYSLAYSFGFFDVALPVMSTLGIIFAAFTAIYLVFFVLAAAQRPGPLAAMKAFMTEGLPGLMKNALLAVVVLVGATTLATVILDTLQTNAGIGTGGLEGDAFFLLVQFTVAPLLEESTYRLTMIGAPVFLLVLAASRSPRRAIRALWRPSSAWDDPGATAPGLRSFVGILIVLSSFMFGYAHYASGAGWGIGKVSEAALAGLALGYLYVTYGFHTNVLMHWTIDYAGTIYAFLAQAIWGVSWTSDTGSILNLFPNIVFVILLGVPSLLLVINEILKVVIRPRARAVGDGSSR